MTEERWKEAEERLSYPFGIVKLKIDGYDITVITEKYSELSYCYVVYVNGKIRAELALNDCEIAKRFYCLKKKYALTPAKKNQLMKKIGKRSFEKFMKDNPQLFEPYQYYLPCFSSFRALKKKFTENNESIEMVEKFERNGGKDNAE